MKFPWLKFFPGDWLKEPSLTICSPATRGIWIDLICVMHESGGVGQLTGTVAQLAKLARCSAAEMEQSIRELDAYKIARVTVRNSKVTLLSRRLKREEITRKNGAIRAARFRRNAARNAQRHGVDVRSQKSDVRCTGRGPLVQGALGDQSPVESAPPNRHQEIPSVDQAVAQTMAVGIPEDFCRFVFADWSSRDGKDAGGVSVRWLPYVTKRWSREQKEWNNGNHHGKRTTPSGQVNRRLHGQADDAESKRAALAAVRASREQSEDANRV